MALQPNDYTAPERLQPGARGELFEVDIPGYRNSGPRVNRTQNNLKMSQHDVLNIKYMFDTRLPVLFRYSYGFGFNQIVIPKGRVVAADPNMDLVDFESQKQFNTLTLANGGVPVRLRKSGDLYKNSSGQATALVSAESQGKEVQHIGREWIPVEGMEKAYTKNAYRPFGVSETTTGTTAAFSSAAKQLTDAGYVISPTSGRVTKNGVEVKDVRPGNIPLGIIERNEYTRNDDAHNGMMPGPVHTDAIVELPWFAFKDKAEENFWGSAYGSLFPGALVKSDENGRITISPLSFPDEVATMSLAEYEAERQQVIGQIYAVNHELVPEGAAKWATWALSDRMNSEEFNPALYRKNNRDGEDAVNTSPFNSEGKYPGYPYEKNYLNHDLHMLASMGRKDVYDPRMNPEYQYSDLGIPGLTDGKNAVIKEMPVFEAGSIRYAGGKDYVDSYFRNLDVNVEGLQISINDEEFTDCVADKKLNNDTFVIKYASAAQGIVVIGVADKAKADALLQPLADGAKVKFKYKKRGLAGVPTFMDWDGCIGSAKILFQK